MNEYISKERAEICVMSAIEGSEGDDVLRALDDVRLAINSEPAARVAPVIHGRWKYVDDDVYTCYKCSACGSTLAGDKSRYCPHCGAEMEESEGTK